MASLRSAAEESSRRHSAQLAAAEKRETALKQQLTTIREETRNKFSALLAQHKSQYAHQGANGFRNFFLQASLGQEFLRILHKYFLAQYQKTNAFMDAASSGLNWIINRAVKVTLAQLEASKEQEAKLNTNTFMAQMELNSLEEVMGIDMTLLADWWTPVMEKAARTFIEGHNKMEGLLPAGQLIYDLSLFKTLTPPRILEINRERDEASSSGETLSSADEVEVQKIIQGGEVRTEQPPPPEKNDVGTEQSPQPEGRPAEPAQILPPPGSSEKEAKQPQN